ARRVPGAAGRDAVRARAIPGASPAGARDPARARRAQRRGDGQLRPPNRAGRPAATGDDPGSRRLLLRGGRDRGEMLTELFVLERPSLARVAEDLRARAAEFGEGLQLVNILKDARPDAAEGRTFLQRQAPLAEVFVLARKDLAQAAAYVDLLRQGGAPAGLVAFNAFISKLATANLQILRDQGLGAKLTRTTVLKIAAEIASAA